MVTRLQSSNESSRARSPALVIGQVPWSRDDMIGKLEEFAALYDERPIKDNRGGMLSPHMFLTWFVLQALQPKALIESGVWLGQGTWLFERACPGARLYCIDPNLDRIQYRSKRAEYFAQDYSTIDWSHLPKDEALVFFDDHQNAYERVKTSSWLGFKHILFEDNYPPSQGDCYSLKKAFMHAGFRPAPRHSQSLKAKLAEKARALLGAKGHADPEILPNETDAKYLRQNLGVYYECPPIFKAERTRWGDRWDEENYPTPEPLLSSVEHSYLQRFKDEAMWYTWMCYVRLK
jgi:hypothetical protein